MKENKIKIFYDYEIVLFQKFGGVSRYIYELVSRNKNKVKKIDIPLYSSRNYYFRDYIKIHKQYKIISPLANEVINIIKLFFNKYDIIHPTYYHAYRFLKFPFIKKKSKVIITVHDMIHELVLNSDKKFLLKKKKMILMADGIICISEKTKQDLISIIPETANKNIKVIYLGNSLESTVTSSDVNLPKEFVLFVGTRDNYKNFKTLLNAFPTIRKNNSDIKLLCVGGGSFSDNEISEINQLGLTDQVLQTSLSDAELAYAYKNSKCFVFSSLYEGFGLPILEAFSCECPVILSECSCFPEIAGEAAIYFDGKNSEDLANKINHLLSDEKERKELINKGVEQLKKYSWEKCASETLEFYKEILK